MSVDTLGILNEVLFTVFLSTFNQTRDCATSYQLLSSSLHTNSAIVGTM
jgi:hypothetical protein